MATTYASTTELKARLNITDSTSDGPLQAILDSAASMVDANTRGQQVPGTEAFTVTASATRLFDDRLRSGGVVEIDDCQSVTALTRGGQTVSSTYYKLYPYQKGTGPYTRLYLLSGTTVLPSIYALGGSGYDYPYRDVGVGQIAVTGTWGYCTAATAFPEIKEATLRLAIRLWENQNLGQGAEEHPILDMTNKADAVVKMLERFVKTEGRLAV
jgi:hypothetical protein